MITVWKKLSDESWEFVQSLENESNLYDTIVSLRLDNEGVEYRAEKRIDSESIILSI